jgi:hypothetical protein
MNKQELIEKYKNKYPVLAMDLQSSNIFKELWGDIKQLDEPQKVTIPQFVADWIEECKDDNFHLFGAMEEMSLHQKKLDYWFREDDNMENFARAWLDGYTVEKEKRYRVKIKNAYYNKCPQFLCETDNGIFWAAVIDLRKTKFTRKELEQAGFGWVFDCEGIEIEEVEG